MLIWFYKLETAKYFKCFKTLLTPDYFVFCLEDQVSFWKWLINIKCRFKFDNRFKSGHSKLKEMVQDAF